MGLQAGTRLGPYEIQEPLGAGGMGEVYRARDTRLDRQVAIKVLPQHLSATPAFRARLEREARAASSLNHPHICTLYDIGSEAGVDYLVMELLEGETLARRLERGALSVDELLPVAVQVSDALDRAHRSGLVHRDLKPGNIMLTRAGAKLMDFGLAKSTGGEAVLPLTSAPTATSPLTAEGSLLGTIMYMAPEQLEGKEADARSDLFALGAVIFEMASGRRAFTGPSQASIIAAILKEQPPSLADLGTVTATGLDRLVQACLIKDPDERIQSAHDIRLQLEWIAAGLSPSSAPGMDGLLPGPAVAGNTAGGGRLAWVIAAGALLLAVAGWLVALRPVSPAAAAPAREVRFTIPGPMGSGVRGVTELHCEPSPDGTMVVFSSRDTKGVQRLFLRHLGSLDATPMNGTTGGDWPFWSPDSRSIAFTTDRTLKRISLAGGSPQVLATMTSDLTGGSWGPDGTILFGNRAGPVLAIDENGGTPRPVTDLDADEYIGHAMPSFLPDGRRFLYLGFHEDPEKRAIHIGSLDGKAPHRLMPSRYPALYVRPGYLLHVEGATLMARPFDIETLNLGERSHLVVDGLASASVPGLASFSASLDGIILYRTPDSVDVETRLVWFSRSGERQAAAGELAADVSVALSPDGNRATVGRIVGTAADSAGSNAPTNIFVTDLSRRIGTRLTTDASHSDENPIWSPDGSRIAYASHPRGRDAVLRIQPASGAREWQELETPGRNPHPHGWSADGKWLTAHITSLRGDLDLVAIPVGPDAQPVVIADSPFHESQGQFSPDGRWVAYSSDLSGAMEVYVQSFPAGDQQWQVSPAGGHEPRWRRDGAELYYLAPDGQLMAVSLEKGDELTAGTAEPLFKVPMFGGELFFYGGAANYSPSADGSAFLINELIAAPNWGDLRVVLNWSPPPD